MPVACDPCCSGWSILKMRCPRCWGEVGQCTRCGATSCRCCAWPSETDARIAPSEPSLSDPEAPTSSEVDSGATEEPEGAQISDPVKRPAHYTHSRVEVIEAIEAWGLGYRLGNVVKYIARHEHKGRSLEDLEKAAWYLAREIAERRKTQGAT